VRGPRTGIAGPGAPLPRVTCHGSLPSLLSLSPCQSGSLPDEIRSYVTPWN